MVQSVIILLDLATYYSGGSGAIVAARVAYARLSQASSPIYYYQIRLELLLLIDTFTYSNKTEYVQVCAGTWTETNLIF